MRPTGHGERERKTDQEADVEDQERQGGKKVPRDRLQDQEGSGGVGGSHKGLGRADGSSDSTIQKEKEISDDPLSPSVNKAYRRCADTRYEILYDLVPRDLVVREMWIV